MVFWIIAGLLAAGVLALVFLPLIRGSGAGGRRASYDMQVYRDQLREVDRDVARGVVAEADAEALRTEIGRKLLVAADAEAREADGARAPRRASLLGGGALALAALTGTLWLYDGQGAPGYPDQPLVLRQVRQAEAWADRPRQAEAEAVTGEQGSGAPAASGDAVKLAERLAGALEGRPDDLEGHRLLVRAMAGIGRFAEAAVAQKRVLELSGGEAGAEDHATHAELMIRATSGYVSPEAEAAIGAALRLDPGNPSARYFLGRMFVQGGWPAEAHAVWSQLLAESPPGAPWIAAIEADIDTVAELAGIAPAGAAPGPGAASMEGGGVDLAQIEGMVAGLGERLASEGGPPEDWARLIRSLGVLGRIGEAASIWEEAQDRFGEDDAAMTILTEAARESRLVQ